MPVSGDIQRIIQQEKRLVFNRFDEQAAFEIGLDLKRRAEQRGVAVAIDVRFWDRVLFSFAMSGTTQDNAHWIRRKTNVVQRFQRASYRLLLERGGQERQEPYWGLNFQDHVFAGGCFPIFIKGVSGVGAVTVSGLPGRDDHELVVEALCAAIGENYEELALPVLA